MEEKDMFVQPSLFFMFFSCTQMENPGTPFAAVELETSTNYIPAQNPQEVSSQEDTPETDADVSPDLPEEDKKTDRC